MTDAPTTVAFPQPLPARRRGRDFWHVDIDGVEVKLTNLDKPFWGPEGYTKADVVGYYHAVAAILLPYLRGRPLTLKRMPDGADGPFFYAKQAPPTTPRWMATAPVRSADTGKTIEYLLATGTASLLWLANLGCIEMHPWHSRTDDLGRPDYAFFDLDPFDADFSDVREVALLVHTVLDQLGLRGYARTSGATGMQVYVPIDRVHSFAQVREWVGRACRLIQRADPGRATMEWSIARRTGKVFLDHGMNTEGRNIASVYSLRPERAAPVATPLTWEEVATDVVPQDFTIATIWARLEQVGDLFTPLTAGGQDLRAAMAALGMDPDAEPAEAQHSVTAVARGAAGPPKPQRRAAPAPERPGDLAAYDRKRDFARTPEPGGAAAGPVPPAKGGPRFVLQHHLATRLHHDLRLERGGVAVSWALPKGLPDVRGLRHLAVQTEDHPLAYLEFEGDIPTGEYGGGPMRIWDRGTYEALEWVEGKVTVRIAGARHRGEFHLFRTGGRDAPEQWLVVRARDDDPPDPPPRFLPMLATAADVPFDDDDWAYEVKWDGIRVLATTVRPGGELESGTTLVSRNGNDVTAAYPELGPLWERVLARNAVLDGEVVAMGPDGRPSFERLQARMHLRDRGGVDRARRQAPVTYLVFDVLAVDGRDCTGAPLSERLGLLDGLLIPGGPLQRSAAVVGDGTGLYDAVVRQGLEGIVAKRLDSRYQPGKRSRSWLKVKVRRTLDAVIGGWLPGEGHRSGSFGSLTVGLYDQDGTLRYVGRVGSGFDGAALAALEGRLSALATDVSPFAPGSLPAEEHRAGRWVRPELVCRVEYGETTSAGRLRAPSYKGLVEDADPRGCLWEDL